MPSRFTIGLLLTLFAVLGLTGCGLTDRAGEASKPSSPTAAGSMPAASPTAVAAVPPTAALAATRSSPAPAPTASDVAASTPAAEATPAAPTTALPATPTPAASPTGIPSRPAGDPAAVQVEVQLVLGGLDRPVGIAHAGDGSGRLFIVEKAGRIQIVREGRLGGAPFLDISERVGARGNEQGLLGLAFHPSYPTNGLFYVNYTDRRGDTVVARYGLGAGPDRADPVSEVMLLTLDQPAANHNGGHLAFGPDGYLYIGTGDGGGAGDQYRNGQNGQSLLGKMLRLDVDGGPPYTIPAGNPFVADPDVRDEIWAVGLRNPWRYSFDRQTGDLYVADVGQNQYEEVNVQPAGSAGGENYGWPIMEGQHCFPESRACDPAGLVLPVVEYDHSLGCSVTGGYLYRGQQHPALAGIYLFGDYCSGTIWGMAPAPAGGWTTAELAQTGLNITSFGEDEAGELYLVDMRAGELFTISASPR